MITNKPIKVLIIGLGSIGSRHARILKATLPSCELLAMRSPGAIPNQLGIRETSLWDEALAFSPDTAFITNPTNMHIKTALDCATHGMHLFIEKPIDASTEGLDELIETVNSKQITAYVAYCMRFHPVVASLQNRLGGLHILHSTVKCTSYLPAWRTGRDSKETYSAKKAMGGGVILDLSHEFDYAEHLFGPVTGIAGSAGRAGDVTVDAEDWADAIVTHQGGHCTNIHLNFMSHAVQRTIEVDTTDGFFRADLVNNTIEHITASGTESKHFVVGPDDMYKAQIKHFIDNLENPSLMNNLTEAAPIFRLVLDFKEKALA